MIGRGIIVLAECQRIDILFRRRCPSLILKTIVGQDPAGVQGRCKGVEFGAKSPHCGQDIAARREDIGAPDAVIGKIGSLSLGIHTVHSHLVRRGDGVSLAGGSVFVDIQGTVPGSHDGQDTRFAVFLDSQLCGVLQKAGTEGGVDDFYVDSGLFGGVQP